MNETSKCYAARLKEDHFKYYLKGHGIDIGCGPDKLKLPDGTQVVGWDVQHGDAQYLKVIRDETFDFVYSSHCLEHMVDVEVALTNWLRVLKNKGYLYVVVPDYTLYEKLRWPSGYNPDHKHSFSLHLTRRQVTRSNHWHSTDVMRVIRDHKAELVLWREEDEFFDYDVGSQVDQTLGKALAQICFVAQKHTYLTEED